MGNKIGRDRVSTNNTDNDGIRVENDAVVNAFTNNFVFDSGLDGISLFADTFDNVVRNNNVQRNGFCRTTARRGSGPCSAGPPATSSGITRFTGTPTAASTSARRSA
ncbi:MAG: hypothetical protein ACRD2W_19630 [Acidimicrobiales bacterium]